MERSEEPNDWRGEWQGEWMAERKAGSHYQKMAGMRIVQFWQNGWLRVAKASDAEHLRLLGFEGGSYELARRAVEERRSVRDFIDSRDTAKSFLAVSAHS